MADGSDRATARVVLPAASSASCCSCWATTSSSSSAPACSVASLPRYSLASRARFSSAVSRISSSDDSVPARARALPAAPRPSTSSSSLGSSSLSSAASQSIATSLRFLLAGAPRRFAGPAARRFILQLAVMTCMSAEGHRLPLAAIGCRAVNTQSKNCSAPVRRSNMLAALRPDCAGVAMESKIQEKVCACFSCDADALLSLTPVGRAPHGSTRCCASRRNSWCGVHARNAVHCAPPCADAGVSRSRRRQRRQQQPSPRWLRRPPTLLPRFSRQPSRWRRCAPPPRPRGPP